MKVRVIAEIASNHYGDLGIAKGYIEMAKRAGADMVKFQYFDVADEFMPKDGPRHDMVKKAQLNLDELCSLWDYCQSVGIGFLVTPFKTVGKLEDLASMGLQKVKIREADSSNLGMIRRALGLFDQVLISTTRLPVDTFFLYHPHAKWLYTVPEYPAKAEKIDLSAFEVFDGFSCHVPNIAVPLAAATIALVSEKEEFWIEVHVILDHGNDVFDSAVSIDFSELAELVKHLRTIERMGEDKHIN